MFISLLISMHINNYSYELPKVSIKSCYDGDTCTTSKGEIIRIACIDAPELKGKKANPVAAKKSRDYLNSLIEGKEVNIRRITKDKYKRTVAELYKNGVNIQNDLIEKGFAVIYAKYAYQCPSLTNN